MAEDFITESDLAAFLELDELDVIFAPFAIDVGCAAIRKFLDQRLTYVEDDEVRMDGSGTDALRLPERPVRDLTSVLEDGVEVSTDLYFLRLSTLYRTDDSGTWTPGRGNFVVTYSHGWDLPDGDSTDSDEDDADTILPADIRLAALSVARRAYSATGAETGSGLTGETIGAYAYTVEGSASGEVLDLIDIEKRALSRYAIRTRP